MKTSNPDSREERDSSRANFLWPPEEGSVEEAGYEFANANTEEYRKLVWEELLKRAKNL